MRQRIIEKRNKLLSWIPKDIYVGLTNFVENIYLLDYDLKIIMARKCSNLFAALIEIVLEEDGGRAKYLYDKMVLDRKANKKTDKEIDDSIPFIITDRALELMKSRIVTEKRYRKILLVDDIIIHGRTLEVVCGKLISWFEEAGIEDYEIQVYAYLENKGGIVSDRRRKETKIKDIMQNRKVEIKCNREKWRGISSQIVDIFYLLGNPYTSYVPNCRIKTDSQEGENLQNILNGKKNAFLDITGINMPDKGVHVYSYVESAKSFAIKYSMRIYKFDEPREFVLVPMVTLNPIDEDVLKKYLQKLKGRIQEEYFNELINDDDCGLIQYRTAIYVISALWGWKFMKDKIGISYEKAVYDSNEELFNFSKKFLKQAQYLLLDAEKLDGLFRQLSQVYDEAYAEGPIEIKCSEISTDMGRLEENLNNVITEAINYSFNNSRSWADVGNGFFGSRYPQLVSKYLSINGKLDEDKVREGADDNQFRMVGLPLKCLIEKMEAVSSNETEAFGAILNAIDFGKGSIVAFEFLSNLKSGRKKCYMSLLHEGEQNYKYYENTYFPFLYGLLYIERKLMGEKSFSDIKICKQKFMEEYAEYWNNEKFPNSSEDIKVIQEMSMTEEYKSVILQDSFNYFDNVHLNKAVKIAEDKISWSRGTYAE